MGSGQVGISRDLSISQGQAGNNKGFGTAQPAKMAGILLRCIEQAGYGGPDNGQARVDAFKTEIWEIVRQVMKWFKYNSH